MLNRPHLQGLNTDVCWSEYARAIPFLQEMRKNDPVHVNVGTIGHVDHAQSPLTACISGALGTLPKPRDYQWHPVKAQPLVLIHASEMDNLLSMLENGMDLRVEVRHPVE